MMLILDAELFSPGDLSQSAYVAFTFLSFSELSFQTSLAIHFKGSTEKVKRL